MQGLSRTLHQRADRRGASGPLSHSLRPAFSLVELVLILAIIATLAMIAAPRYANAMAHYRAELAARRIVADLAHARAQAKASSQSWTVSFNPPANSYIIFDDTVLGNATTVTTVVLSEPPYHASITAAVFGADSDVVFDGYGASDGGGTVNVHSGGFQRQVVLDGDTGKGAVK